MNGAVDGSDSHLRARLRDVVTQARMFDTPAAMAQNLWSRLFTAGAKDWQAQSADGHGLRAAAATQLRRQRRLWGA